MSSIPDIRIHPLPTPHRFSPGDDLVSYLLSAVRAAELELEDSDVVCIASKAIAITEAAFLDLPDSATSGSDEHAWVRELARSRAGEVVAESPWVTITRTHHGFVAANGGIDRSNVPGDGWLDLPSDPDASAAALREELSARTGRDVAVVVTDTFGRPWRLGQTDVALGAAGLAVLRDERGSTDLDGRTLGVTVAAVGDAVAGAADLVRSKASATPFVLVRGLSALTAAGGAATGRGADLIRPLEEDLFRRGAAEATVEGIVARRTVRAFDPDRSVSERLITEAVAAASTAPAPHHTRPWRFVRLTATARTQLLDAMADAWRADLAEDGLGDEAIAARIERSDALHRAAPELLAVFVDLADAHRYPDDRRTRAERDLFVLSGGAAIEAMLVTLAARGLGGAWTSSTVFCADTVRGALDVPATWEPLGTVAIGWPSIAPDPRPRPTVDDVLEER